MSSIFQESFIIFNLVVKFFLNILEQLYFGVNPCNCNSDLWTISKIFDRVLLHLIYSTVLLKEREIDLALTNLLLIVLLSHINDRKLKRFISLENVKGNDFVPDRLWSVVYLLSSLGLTLNRKFNLSSHISSALRFWFQIPCVYDIDLEDTTFHDVPCLIPFWRFYITWL